MALIKCHECGKEISDSAEQCPHCGCKTKRGTTVSKAKGLMASYVIVLALMIVGVVLFFTSMYDLQDHSSYFWNSGSWRHDEDTIFAIIKLLLGIGFVIGGIIDMVRIRNQANYLTVEEETKFPKRENLKNPERLVEIKTADVAFIPPEKRMHGMCEMCKSEGMIAECEISGQYGSYKLCPKCVRKYSARIL